MSSIFSLSNLTTYRHWLFGAMLTALAWPTVAAGIMLGTSSLLAAEANDAAPVVAAADEPLSAAESQVAQSEPPDTADEAGGFKQWLQQALRRSVGPPLKALHAPVDRWLGALPMSVALACAVGLYVVAIIWVWTLRREFVFRGAPDQKWWRDLRLWATVVTLPYIAVYLLLGR